MFGNNEIAKKALRRIEEIKKSKIIRRRQRSVAGISLCMCVVMSAIVIFLTKPPVLYTLVDDEEIPLSKPLLPDDGAVFYVEGEEESRQGYIIPGYDNVVVFADTSEAEIVLFNPDGNPCRFVFEIALADTEETLYTSGLVAPSMCIEKITLARPLAKGEYKGVLIIRAYEMESLVEINGARVGLDLIVQ